MVFKKFDDRPKRDFPRGPLGGRRDSWGPRKMIQGNWKCADCGKEITELPFEPAPDRPIYCRECWSKKREQRTPRFER